MAQKKKDNKNMLLVSIIIGVFLIFMLGTVIYVTSQVANCSSGKKLRKQCTVIIFDHKLTSVHV